MASVGHRAAPLRGTAGLGGRGGGASRGGCPVPVSPRWVLGAGGLRHGPKREVEASLGTHHHLLIPVTPRLSGDPQALSQPGWPG